MQLGAVAHEPTPMPLTGRTLIGSNAALEAALVGLVVESSGGQPLFAREDEPLGAALLRLRPMATALIGVDLSEAQSDLFFALADKHGVRVVVFGSLMQLRAIAAVASERGTAWFSLPPIQPGTDVAAHLTEERRARASDDRRQEPHALVGSDGTPVLVDQGGTHWLVYDRRATSARRQVPDPIDRTFVSELGERVTCAVESTLADDASAATLVDQLARARQD